MKHTTRVLWLVVLALCPCLVWGGEDSGKKDDAPPTQPQKKQWRQLKPDRLISDSTFIYVSTPDLVRAKNAFNRTAFHALVTEDEVLTPVLATFAKMRDTYVKGDGTRSELELRRRSDEVALLTKLSTYFDGQLALAIDALPAQNAGAKFTVVASMPPGDAGEERQRVLEEIFERHRYNQTTDPRFRDFDDTVGPYNIHRIECPDLNLIETWAFVENLFIYGQGKNVVEDAINRYLKNGGGTLSLHNGYINSYKQVGKDERGDALVYLQLDTRSILQRALDQFPDIKKLAGQDSQGENSHPQIAIGIQVGDGDNAPIREKVFVRTNKDALKPTEPCRASTARFTPGDTLGYTAWTGTLYDSYPALVDNLKMLAKHSLGGKETTFDQQLRNALNVQNDNALKEKLDLFKGETSIMVSFVPRPNLKIETPAEIFQTFTAVFALELDRENAVSDQSFRTMMQSIEAATGQSYISTTYNANNVGYMIRYQQGLMPREERKTNTPLGMFANIGMGDLKNMPFFAAYARIDIDAQAGEQPRKFVLFSDSLEALKKSIAQSGATRSSLSEEKRFKALLKTFRESMNEVNYVDLNRMVDVYTMLLPVLGKSGALSREVLTQLPSPTLLSQHFYPMGWAKSIVADQDGVVTEFSSPTGNLTLLGMVASIAYPAINEEQKKRVSEEVDAKFKHIGLALQLYAADFDRYPLQLSDLHPGYDRGELKVYESPFKRNLVLVPADIDNPDVTNLIYVSGKSLQDLAKDIILYEREPTLLVKSNDGTKLLHHVLTIDGKMQGLPRASLERRLGGKVEFPTGNSETASKPKQ
jgi:hypothetical protein